MRKERCLLERKQRRRRSALEGVYTRGEGKKIFLKKKKVALLLDPGECDAEGQMKLQERKEEWESKKNLRKKEDDE